MAFSIAGSKDLVEGAILDAIVAMFGLTSVGENFKPRDNSSV